MNARAIKDLYTTQFVIFQNYIELHGLKGWCNCDRILKYHSFCTSIHKITYILENAFSCFYGNCGYETCVRVNSDSWDVV